MLMRIPKFFLLPVISFSAIVACAQTKSIDSLKRIADAAKGNDEKLAAVVAYCQDYSNVAQDSLEKYAYIAIELAAKSTDERLKSLAWLTLAQDYMQWGWTDSVHVVVDHELTKNPVTDSSRRDIYFRLKRLKAVAFGADGKYQESLEILYPLVQEAEKYNDSLIIAGISNSIGALAMNRNEFAEAYKWNDKALTFLSGSYKKYLGSAYISRAQLMYKENKIDSGLYFLEKGLEYCRNIEMYDRLASGYRFQSAVFTEMNRLDEAETALKNMQAARSRMNKSPDAIIEDNLQIAEFYANTGQLRKAIQFCWSKLEMGDLHKKGADSSKTFNNDPSVRLPFYLALARYLKEDNDHDAYQKVLEEIIVLKDTVYERNKAEAIAELQTKYDVEQKENTIIAQQLKLTQRNYLLYGSLVFIVLAAIITWLWWRNQHNKQQIRMQQAIDEEKRQAAQSILDAEEKERKRIAADLHDNIGAYATAISADVENITGKGLAASREQLDNLQVHSKEIIYSLRDTIWVLNKENITITNISDRIKNYINKLKPSYEFINISVEENIENDGRIGSQKALNIFRIVQEAIHNALKHSNAKRLDINIESKEKISILIKDDGKGITMPVVNEGNGLRNMQARATDAGIKFSVQSAAGKGTRYFIGDYYKLSIAEFILLKNFAAYALQKYMQQLRIGITDDKAINRNNIAEKVKQFEDLQVCFTAVNGNDCLEQLKGLPLEKMPQIMFMDIEMPELDGIQTISISRSLYPQIYFIVLTVFDDDDKIFEAIKAGAHGYLLKDENAASLHNAIINVVESNGAPMSPAIARKALQLLSQASVNIPEKKSIENNIAMLLSEREREILQYTVHGHDAKRIAEITGISVLTVRKHIANIYQKLHVNSKAQIMRIAYDKKLM